MGLENLRFLRNVLEQETYIIWVFFPLNFVYCNFCNGIHKQGSGEKLVGRNKGNKTTKEPLDIKYSKSIYKTQVYVQGKRCKTAK